MPENLKITCTASRLVLPEEAHLDNQEEVHPYDQDSLALVLDPAAPSWLLHPDFATGHRDECSSLVQSYILDN